MTTNWNYDTESVKFNNAHDLKKNKQKNPQ